MARRGVGGGLWVYVNRGTEKLIKCRPYVLLWDTVELAMGLFL